MATLTYDGQSYTVDHAVKGPNYVHGYDADGNAVVSIIGVADFSGIDYNVEYMNPDDCLSEACNTVKMVSGEPKTADGDDAPLLTEADASTLGESGARNLLRYPYQYTTRTASGIVWTDNGDGTVSARGTNELTSQNLFNCRARTENFGLVLKPGTYTLSGCPEGGSPATYYIQVGRTLNESYKGLGNDYGDGVTFSITEDVQIQVQLAIITNSAVDVTFKPMLEFGKVVHNFVPYVLGSAETVNGFKIFTSAKQVGVDSYHIPDIVKAMPANSMLIEANESRYSDASANNNMPHVAGTIEIVKPRADIGRTKVTLFNCVNAGKYSMYFCDLDEVNWAIKGWRHFGDGCNADTLDTYHATDFLRLNAGGTIDGQVRIRTSGYDCLQLENTSLFNTMISFKGTNGNNGAIGFINVNKPVVMNDKQDTFYELHHDGNSMKVQKGNTAPSDTNTLWIDTSA